MVRKTRRLMDWTRILDALGYPSAGLGILVESAGVPFPGDEPDETT